MVSYSMVSYSIGWLGRDACIPVLCSHSSLKFHCVCACSCFVCINISYTTRWQFLISPFLHIIYLLMHHWFNTFSLLPVWVRARVTDNVLCFHCVYLCIILKWYCYIESVLKLKMFCSHLASEGKLRRGKVAMFQHLCQYSTVLDMMYEKMGNF